MYSYSDGRKSSADIAPMKPRSASVGAETITNRQCASWQFTVNDGEDEHSERVPSFGDVNGRAALSTNFIRELVLQTFQT